MILSRESWRLYRTVREKSKYTRRMKHTVRLDESTNFKGEIEFGIKNCSSRFFGNLFPKVSGKAYLLKARLITFCHLIIQLPNTFAVQTVKNERTDRTRRELLENQKTPLLFEDYTLRNVEIDRISTPLIFTIHLSSTDCEPTKHPRCLGKYELLLIKVFSRYGKLKAFG